MRRELLALTGLALLLAVPRPALAADPSPSGAAQAATPQATPAKQPSPEEKVRLHEEVTVESASKVDQKLIDAPATMSVVTSQQLAAQPAQNMADTLRSVPGLNVIQMSARDINLTARQATSTLATSELVSVDGRSVYLDFFGLVLWDLVPSPTSGDIKQIEVVRGPASVVWGANAVNGVVNIITKTPREGEGFGLVLSGGLFNRDAGSRKLEGDGYQFNGAFSYAHVINDTWSYRLNAGYFHSDPYSRPTGQVPLDCHPLGAIPCRTTNAAGQSVATPGGVPIGGATYPPDSSQPGGFPNDGTDQPKFTLRVDQDFKQGGRILYEGGYDGTTGIVHTGIGPFQLKSPSYLAYGRVSYSKGALKLSAFANFLNATAPNLIATDPNTLQPVVLDFTTQTYDFEVGNTNVVAQHHIFTYGGNLRQNNFDISLAKGPNRTEYGGYLQWEYFVDKFRFAAGGRVDKFGNISSAVFSPRVSVMFKPTPTHSIRASYNRAFVSPSFINNHLNQDISFPSPVNLCGPPNPAFPPGSCTLAVLLNLQFPGLNLGSLVPTTPFLLTVNSFGNDALKEQSTDQWEVAYTGTFNDKTTVGLALYTSKTNDNINFTYLYPPGTPGYPPPTYYSVTNPARGITVPTATTPSQPITLSPVRMGILSQLPPQYGGPILLPYGAATYLNLGPIRNRGIEASIDQRFTREWSAFANYSWQDTPKPLTAGSGEIPYPAQEVGIPSEHRFNAGLAYDGKTFLANANVNYASKALWTDVLNASYAGYTDAYTMLNATFGVKLAEGKVMVSLKGTNLTNSTIQQHNFGDILKRAVVLELRYFAK